MPGNHIQTGQTWILGSSASSIAFWHEQNIFVCDLTRTCVSSHMMISYFSEEVDIGIGLEFYFCSEFVSDLPSFGIREIDFVDFYHKKWVILLKYRHGNKGKELLSYLIWYQIKSEFFYNSCSLGSKCIPNGLTRIKDTKGYMWIGSDMERMKGFILRDKIQPVFFVRNKTKRGRPWLTESSRSSQAEIALSRKNLL